MVRIEPEGIWKTLYKKAYYRETGNMGRRLVDLVNSEEDRTTISYAKYLICIKLDRLLTEDEQVDHIDGDKRNDSLDNLQVLSVEEHKKKTADESRVEWPLVTCAYCGKEFYKKPNQFRYNQKIGAQPHCSRSCNGKHNGKGSKGKLTPDQVREIRKSEEAAKVLAQRFGVTKGTIYLIRNRQVWKDITD